MILRFRIHHKSKLWKNNDKTKTILQNEIVDIKESVLVDETRSMI